MANLTHYVFNLNVLHLIGLLFFTLNYLNIPNVNQSKYLGIVINETNCNPELKRQMCKQYANVNMILRKSMFLNVLSMLNVVLFKFYCSNLYCSIDLFHVSS